MQSIRLIYFISAVFAVIHCQDWKKSNVSLLAEELDDSFNFTCIVEGNSAKSAVTWITPLEHYKLLKPSQYIPNLAVLQNYENNHIEEEWIPQKWSLSSSFDYPFKAITDYRWENFPITSASNMVLIDLTRFFKEIFYINLSFRIKNNAVIYLCSTAFINDHKEGCFSININTTDIVVIFQDDHSTLRNMSISYLNNNQWAHLNIIYSHQQLKVRFMGSGKTLSCKTNRYSRSPQYLFVQSKEISLWKLHQYKFISTNKSGITQIGKQHTISRGTFCISLYVALCPTCVIKITTDYSDFRNNSQMEETEEKSDGKYSWKEVKIIREYENNGYVEIYLVAINENVAIPQFWALDDIRHCHPNEIRTANLQFHKKLIEGKGTDIPGSIKCQPLLENSLSISKPEAVTVNCEDKTKLGVQCNITCESIFGKDKKNCEKNVICMDNDPDEGSNCHCAIGYEGATCKNECHEGSWGFGCKAKCGFCKNRKCNIFNGICDGECEEGFIEPLCTKLTAVKNLHEVNATENSITIEWDSLQPPTRKISFKYVVEYKRKKSKMCAGDISDEITYTTVVMGTSLIVTQLEPYSEYFFNVMAIAETFSGKSRTITVWTSATETLQQEEVLIRFDIKHDAADGFPQLIWTEPPCSKIRGSVIYDITLTCSNEWCEEPVKLYISFQNKYDEKKVFQYSVPNLIPYSDYIVTFVTRRSIDHGNKGTQFDKEFKTKEKEPLRVRNLTVYSQNENGISLRWKPPYPPRGYLESYFIQCFGNHFCKSKTVRPTPCDVWEDFHCAELSQLEENTSYNIQVKAKNVGVEYHGVSEYIRSIYTRQSASEPPLNVNIMWNQDIPSLQWDHPDITNGPLKFFNIEINVIDSEILNRTKFQEKFNVEIYKKKYSYEMNNLNYSTIYEIKVHAVNKFQGKPSENVTIKMPPPTPEFLVLPSINCSNLICELKISKPINVGRSSYLYVIVDSNKLPPQTQNVNTNQLLTDSAIKEDEQKSRWQAVALPISNHAQDFITITLGNGTKTTSKRYGDAFNKPLQNDTNYIITVILENYYMGETRSNKQVVHVFIEESSNDTNIALYGLLSLLLIPIIAIGGWILYRKYKITQSSRISNNIPWLSNCTQRQSLAEELQLMPANLESGSEIPLDLTAKEISTCILLQKYNCLVSFNNFETFVRNSLWTNADGELHRQYSLFVQGQTKPAEYGIKPKNKSKNRSDLVLPYDHSRVILEKLDNNNSSDYINASYIEGFNTQKAYIATQCPKEDTVQDFWRMIWQEHVTTIVTLSYTTVTSQQPFQYWPKLNTIREYGPITVHHYYVDNFGIYICRTFELSSTDEKRIIQQLHFTSWPEHEVPIYPQNLIPFVKRINIMTDSSAPIVVHGNLGIGRTATVILCDIILKMAKHERESTVDFLGILQKLREDRPNMISNVKQYVLAHLVVLEILFGKETIIPCNDQLPEKIKILLLSNETLKHQLDYIHNFYWVDQVMYSLMPKTTQSATERSCTLDISYTEVDGYDLPAKYITIQHHLRHLWSDFWKLVVYKNIAVIVSLNDVESNSESWLFWPIETETTIMPTESIIVECVKRVKYVNRTITTLLVTYVDLEVEQMKRTRTIIQIINMKGWPQNEVCLTDLSNIISTWEDMNRISKQHDHILVTCRDGITACGAFVAICFLFDKMSEEKQCDVCFSVRMVRRHCQKFVQHKEQLELLYQAAMQYARDFLTYSEVDYSKM